MEFMLSLQSNVDTLKPSLFELLAEYQLRDLIPPSLRYLLAVATHRHPRYLLRILNSYDEIYSLLSLAVEKYYLENHFGSFTENFYGLKREKVLRIQGGELKRTQLAAPDEVRQRLKLGRGDVWRNLVVLVGIPYLKAKLDESYDIHITPSASFLGGPQFLDRDALPPNATIRQRFFHVYKTFLRKVYPTLNATYYLAILAFSLGYLFDSTKYSSPFLWLIGTRMRRMGQVDYQAIEAASNAVTNTELGRPGQGLSGIFSPRTLYPRLLASLKIMLPASIFALKFLEWWHASDFSRQLSRKAAEALELPPPVVSGMGLALRPKAERSEKQSANTYARRDPPVSSITYLPIFTVPPPSDSELCPICLHPITNPAATGTGYVFDYKCIFQWLEGETDRQQAFMQGEKMSEWEEDEEQMEEEKSEAPKSREGKWDSGNGRCAVTGRRMLGGTSGLRRVMV